MIDIENNEHIGRSVDEVIAEFLEDNPEAQEMMERERLITSVANYVRDLRQSNGITQAELAEKLETKQSAIARLENANSDRLPNIELLFRIARVFNKKFGFYAK